jgi:hypothetical protein
LFYITKTSRFNEFDIASDNPVPEMRCHVVEEAVLTPKFGNIEIFDFKKTLVQILKKHEKEFHFSLQENISTPTLVARLLQNTFSIRNPI